MSGKKIEENVSVSLEDLISYDIEWLNDEVEERIGKGLLCDINYTPVKVDSDGSIVLRVRAEAQPFDD